MATDSRCTVCIANYNGRALLADCIESILSQGLGDQVDILVHDDASTDDSVDFLREHYPQVQIIASETNVGFCIGNNRMVAAAGTPFVLLLNNDAALMPGALSALLDVSSTTTEEVVLTLPQYDWQSGALVDRGCLLDPFYNPVPNEDISTDEVAMTIGACLWIRRAFWDEIGGFPAWMESIGEDLYLCCVARLRGAHVRALATSGYRHWQGKTFGGNRAGDRSLSTTLRRRRLSERNKTFAMVTCTPGIGVWPLLAMHLCILAIEGVALALVRRSWHIFRDIYLAVPLALIHHRGTLIAQRKVNLADPRVMPSRYFSVFRLVPRKLTMLLRYGWPRVTR